MKLRRVTVAALIAVGVAAVTLMIDLVTNAASEQQRWPGALSFIQQYPWQSFGLLAVAAVILAAMLPAVSEPNKTARPPAEEPSAPQQSVGSAAVLRTLPRDIAGFTDREQVRTIDGMAEVGKTAFAIHVGHLLAPNFPDGQLFLNLNGHTPGREPVEPGEALASLLLADGVAPQKIPNSDDSWAETEARAAMWRTRVADRRMLLIFDNAATFAQVEHLLPGAAGSLVLITSRRRLAAPDIQWCRQRLERGDFVGLAGDLDLVEHRVVVMVDDREQVDLAARRAAAAQRLAVHGDRPPLTVSNLVGCFGGVQALKPPADRGVERVGVYHREHAPHGGFTGYPDLAGQGMRRPPQRGQHIGGCARSPLRYRCHGSSSGQYRADREGEDPDQGVPATAPPARVW